MIAFYAGSFDPVTNGHLDIIKRADDLFDGLVVGIGINPAKTAWWNSGTRCKVMFPHIEALSDTRKDGMRIKLVTYTGLTVNVAREHKADVLIRGMRNASDLSHEMEIARLNRRIGEIETLFLQPSDDKLVISSSFVRQLVEFGGWDMSLLDGLVPDNVIDELNRSRPARHPMEDDGGYEE
jgi:pantetheine-phosphate adenylyltransferase